MFRSFFGGDFGSPNFRGYDEEEGGVPGFSPAGSSGGHPFEHIFRHHSFGQMEGMRGNEKHEVGLIIDPTFH